jgi:hypothetical protein
MATNCGFMSAFMLYRNALRFVTVVALAVWFGGFTFYSTAVIATSQKVLHSQLRAGLITQQVTNWLNWISLPALAICAWNWLAQSKGARRFSIRVLGLSLLGMVVCQAGLFVVHRLLDAQIQGNDVADGGAFFKLHRTYLALSTAQWCGTLVYIWMTLCLWAEQSEEAGLREGDKLLLGTRGVLSTGGAEGL